MKWTIFCISDLVRKLKNLVVKLVIRQMTLGKWCLPAFCYRIICLKKSNYLANSRERKRQSNLRDKCVIGINHRSGSEKSQSLQNTVCRCLFSQQGVFVWFCFFFLVILNLKQFKQVSRSSRFDIPSVLHPGPQQGLY